MTPDARPAPHPAFAAHFTNSIYDPDADDNDEQLPFGTDDGSDTLSRWQDNADVLRADPRLDLVLGFKASDLAKDAAEDEESADQLISACFVLLRATGTITPADQRLVLKVLRRQAANSSDDTYQTLLDDLSTLTSQGISVPPGRTPPKERPWLIISEGWNDPPHVRWLRRITQKVSQDDRWNAWWDLAPVERLELVPRPVGWSPAQPPIVERNGRTITVVGSSEELFRLFRQLQETDPLGTNVDFKAGIHHVHPDAPRMFRELIMTLAQAGARYLRMPAPPTLPPTRPR